MKQKETKKMQKYTKITLNVSKLTPPYALQWVYDLK